MPAPIPPSFAALWCRNICKQLPETSSDNRIPLYVLPQDFQPHRSSSTKIKKIINEHK